MKGEEYEHVSNGLIHRCLNRSDSLLDLRIVRASFERLDGFEDWLGDVGEIDNISVAKEDFGGVDSFECSNARDDVSLLFSGVRPFDGHDGEEDLSKLKSATGLERCSA